MPYNLYINGIDLQILLWWRFPVNISSQALTTVIETVLAAYLRCIYTFPHSIAFSVHISILCMMANWEPHDEVFNFLKTVKKSTSVPGLKKFRCTDCKSFMKIHSFLLGAGWHPAVSSLLSGSLWGICKLMKVWGQKAELGYHPRASEGGRLFLLQYLLTAP